MSDGTTREYYFAVYLNLLDYLVEQYKADAPDARTLTAALCDEKLDRSGRLLGRVRGLALPRPHLSTPEKPNG